MRQKIGKKIAVLSIWKKPAVLMGKKNRESAKAASLFLWAH